MKTVEKKIKTFLKSDERARKGMVPFKPCRLVLFNGKGGS